MRVAFKKTISYAQPPIKAHEDDACYDLFAREGGSIAPFEVAKIKTGIAIAIPEGYEGQIRGRTLFQSVNRKIMAEKPQNRIKSFLPYKTIPKGLHAILVALRHHI